jgi:(p)ppGpp synthase/HD superfamily hydrolase
MTAHYKKLRNVLSCELRIRGWFRVLKCLAFAELHHGGTRKDGVTPEFEHQVTIALAAVSMIPMIKHPEETICAILLHDTPEDADVEWSAIRAVIVGSMPDIFGENPDDVAFSRRVLQAVEKLTKVHFGAKKAFAAYLFEMIRDPISSLAKLMDRDHNLGTMVGVFTLAKIEEYIEETMEILNMAKKARRLHPEQHAAYEIVKQSILSKLKLAGAYVDAARAAGRER